LVSRDGSVTTGHDYPCGAHTFGPHQCIKDSGVRRMQKRRCSAARRSSTDCSRPTRRVARVRSVGQAPEPRRPIIVEAGEHQASTSCGWIPASELTQPGPHHRRKDPNQNDSHAALSSRNHRTKL
jgi:hypothetical protein